MIAVSPYLIIYLIMMVIYRLLERSIMQGIGRSLDGSKTKDLTSYFIAVPFILAIVEIPLEHFFTGRRPAPVFFYGGMTLFIAATVFRVKALRDIKEGFSANIEKKEGHVLVTHGVYSLIRHPLYLSVLLMVIGAAIMLAAFWAWFFILAIIAAVLIRIREEEKFLLEHFPEYQVYCQKTWRLVPGIY